MARLSLAAAKEKNPENVWRASEVTFLKPSVRFGLLADILATRTDGRFTPKSGHEMQIFSTFDFVYN